MNNPNTSYTTLAETMPLKFPTHYTLSGQDGSIEIPYLPMGECCTSIVRELERQMGGAPEPGMRSNFIFCMACHLRHVCDDNAEWIAAIMPTYGQVARQVAGRYTEGMQPQPEARDVAHHA